MSKLITIRFPEDLLEILDKCSEKDKRKRSAAILIAVREWTDKILITEPIVSTVVEIPESGENILPSRYTSFTEESFEGPEASIEKLNIEIPTIRKNNHAENCSCGMCKPIVEEPKKKKGKK